MSDTSDKITAAKAAVDKAMDAWAAAKDALDQAQAVMDAAMGPLRADFNLKAVAEAQARQDLADAIASVTVGRPVVKSPVLSAADATNPLLDVLPPVIP